MFMEPKEKLLLAIVFMLLLIFLILIPQAMYYVKMLEALG